MTIERWNPFGEMLTLREAINRLFEESFVQPSSTQPTSAQIGVPIDLRETDDQYILEASLPGVRPEDINITVQGSQLTLQAEQKQEEEKKGEHYLYRERRHGQFRRTLTLPTNIQADQVICELKNGQLTVTLPKAEEAKPRRIQITSGEQQQQIEGQAREVGQQT